MKKTLTVNLGGTVFHIDEDAYRLLDNYLSNLKHYFRKQEGAQEIVSDIETRICELFLEMISSGQQVITIEDVDSVIARMGKPEDFETEAQMDSESSAQSAQQTTQQSDYSQTAHRLYRNPDDKILGGVLGGFASYMGWDVTLVRLLALVLIFCYGVMIPIYIVCWIIIPQANTADEKLAMRGQPINVENIGRTVTDGFERATNGVNDFINSDKPRTFLQKLADVLVSIAGFLIKFILIVALILFSPVLFVLILAFFVMIVAAIFGLITGGAFLVNLPYTAFFHHADMSVWGVLACIMVIGIPVFSVVYAICSSLLKWPAMIAAVKWTLLGAWVVAFGYVVYNLANNNWPEMISNFTTCF